MTAWNRRVWGVPPRCRHSPWACPECRAADAAWAEAWGLPAPAGAEAAAGLDVERAAAPEAAAATWPALAVGLVLVGLLAVVVAGLRWLAGWLGRGDGVG